MGLEPLKKTAPFAQLEVRLGTDFLFDDNDLAAIVLRLIENTRLSHGHVLEMDLTLEHVLPEQHKKHWGEIDNVDRLKYSLGNMLLVKLEPNKKLSNKKLDDKKTLYQDLKVFDSVADESLQYTKADQDAWVSEFVLKREADLLTQFKKLLRVE